MLLPQYTVHGQCGKKWCTILKPKGQDMPQIHHAQISLTQNMNIMHLKPRVSDSTQSTQQDQLKKALPKSTVPNGTIARK